jgi:hypothetical protein
MVQHLIESNGSTHYILCECQKIKELHEYQSLQFKTKKNDKEMIDASKLMMLKKQSSKQYFNSLENITRQ